MDRPIPGFYYDKEKKRYFKIVGSGHAAPASAAYSTDNVKKRKTEEQKADRARKRHEKTRDLIKRASVLRNPITGGRLVREFGLVDPELPVESWTSGLRDKGGIDFAPHHSGTAPVIARMMVNGDDTRSGMGVVYASTTNDTLAGSYLPTDEKERINFKNDPQMRRSRLYQIRTEAIFLNSMTSLNYHKPSHTVIMTDRRFSNPFHLSTDGSFLSEVVAFSPKLARDSKVSRLNDGNSDGDGDEDGDEDNGDDMDTDQQDVDTDMHRNFPPHPSNRPLGGDPRWLLGECDWYGHYRLDEPNLTVNSVRTAPASHPGSLMLIATNLGLLEVRGDNVHDWSFPRFIHTDSYNGDHEDVLSADYHPTNPHVVFVGRRDGNFFYIDRRTAVQTKVGKHGEWKYPSSSTRRHVYQGASSIAHLKALDDHQLLAAGPTSAMAVYDVRWMKTTADSSSGKGYQGGTGRGKGRRPQQQRRSTTTPVVRMYEYTNMPHINIGLDVAMGLGGTGGGVVAAGQDDGTVGLFSIRTGRKLPAGDIDRIKHSENQGVIKAIQFATMPWEREPSLFVGVGSVVKKYSFGTGEEEDD